MGDVEQHTKTGQVTSTDLLELANEVTIENHATSGMRHEPLPVMDLETDTVGWDSQTDPDIPFNLPKREKWTWVWLLSIITLIGPFTSSILSPAINILDKELNDVSATVGSLTVTIYLVGYVVGPVFIGPLSEIHGRKNVLNAANCFFCLWQIGCAMAPNIATLIVSRFFGGIGGAACLALGASIIGDMFRPDERGFAIGMWGAGPLFGPTIGPLLGGFLAESIGWRWDFWISLAAVAPTTLLMILLTRETSHKVLIERKATRLRHELGRESLKSCYEDSSRKCSTTQTLFVSLIRPLKVLVFSQIVLPLSLYIAFTFGVVYLLYTTIPSVFEDQYGFNTGETGLVYISLGLGNTLAWLLFTLYSDKLVIRLAQANAGTFTPEMRLSISIPFGILLPISLFWYGWSAYYNLHWACTIVSLVPFGFGIMGLYMPISTYLVDSYPIYAASVTSANVIVRSFVGATLPLAGPSLYSHLGLGWGNTLLGFFGMIMIPLPLFFYKSGGRLRKAQRFSF